MYDCLVEPAAAGYYSRSPAQEFIEFLAPRLCNGNRVLQLGDTQDGAITFGLRSAVQPTGQVIGVYGPGQNVDHAKEPTQEVDMGNVTFLNVPDLPVLPFKDNYFDAVYACNIMAHLPVNGKHRAVIKMLQEMKRVTKPSGLVVSRDLAAQHFFPNSDLEDLITKTLFKATGLRT
ncbi:hypothetical protein E0Z10_g2334 [Xylaria hypoxylon]|uniref:Methyltransferase type 11 domain-containing protein n=1 Tax=Xylaria hypoxylon TaxID=37992 RepID=A0A4Z0YR52_9PEZI|nr:hypothetical protein E0Z10_g2334 [Xylaria hypoxylon]